MNLSGAGKAMQLFDLSGQVAIITGSSRGIGRAIAGRMAEHGARVVVSSRKADTCRAASEAINTRVEGMHQSPCRRTFRPRTICEHSSTPRQCFWSRDDPGLQRRDQSLLRTHVRP